MTDNPPVPKPRTGSIGPCDLGQRPIPLPRTKVPQNNDKVSDILRSISTASKQLSEDVALKVTTSAKTANETIEKSLLDGSKFAKDTLEKTLVKSRAVRDSVTRSVIEGTKTAGLKLRITKRENSEWVDNPRCVSMPAVDVSLFDNIQFHSPLLEQKKMLNDTDVVQANTELQPNSTQFDELSLFSHNSDSNADTVSNFSYDSRESEHQNISLHLEQEQLTYDTPRSSRTNSIVGNSVTPEVPERRKKRQSNVSYMKQNSLYENWTLPHPSTNVKVRSEPDGSVTSEDSPRPSKSTIYEFDPLNTSKPIPKYDGVSNELLLLESFLIGDTYGTIVSNDSNEETFDFAESDYFNPPTPPERQDSLFPMDDNGNKTHEPVHSDPLSDHNRSTNWFVTDTNATELPQDHKQLNTSVMQKFSNMLKFDNVLHKSNKQNVPKPDVVEKPVLNSLPVSFFSGTLTRIVSGVVEDLFKNSQSRYCVLSDQKILCYTDPTNAILKEAYTLDSIYSLQVVLPLSSSTTSNSYCFELTLSTGIKSTPRKVLFSCTSAPERRNWAQKIAEHLTAAFPTKYTSEYTRCGWCYLKEGVSGEWRGAWVMLIRRVLVYSTKEEEVRSVDLRKTRCVVSQEADEETRQRCPSDGCDNLLLDCPHATLYLRFPHERELKGWRYMIKLAAHNNGAHIHHQQLTRDEVPTLVDKSISFIYAHGSLSEGIYRRAGSNVTLSELLAKFRRDAWSVQLCPGQHSEHDVAGVLKRFFRDLPEPLVPREHHATLIDALELPDATARHALYRHVMTSLPAVARQTARKLFAHLHFVHTMAHANKMGAENLASVWAPTVMPAALTSNAIQTAWSSKEVLVIRDFIQHFESIWQPTDAEKRREAAIRIVLTRVLSSAQPAPRKAAGDLRAWVYIHDRNTCHQVALTPNKTCADLCIELCDKANTDSHLLMLEEVICNDSMRRIIHVTDLVLDVVLRWGYWDEEDRKHNYLLLSHNKTLHEMEALRPLNSHVCGELKFANETSKAFKTHMFEFKNSKLCYFKDKQGSQKVEEWDIKDIIWYIGHESKRNPQSRWAITFIPKKNKKKRSKDRPWFGSTVAGTVTEDQLKWTAAMTFAEYSNILPTPRLVIT